MTSEKQRMYDDQLFEMNHDLNRSTMTLDDESTDLVNNARDGLLTALGMMTSGIPKEPTEEDIVQLTRLVATCVRFRNIIRAQFIKHDPDSELPEGFNEAEGHYDPIVH